MARQFRLHFWWRFYWGIGTYGKGDYSRYARIFFLGYWLPQQECFSDSSKWKVCALHIRIPFPFWKCGHDSKGGELRRCLCLTYRYA